MIEALLGEFWDGRQFSARGLGHGRHLHTASLLHLLPILAAEHFPAAVNGCLAAQIELHLTTFGLATERPDSPHYAPDGYWRGPIWAPSTVIIEDGLRSAGQVELADRVSERFRALCEQSGFAENFDALTGQGLRDRAYTWTASAYLLLAEQWVRRQDVGVGPGDS
jgi:glycogen debranching enzyme